MAHTSKYTNVYCKSLILHTLRDNGHLTKYYLLNNLVLHGIEDRLGGHVTSYDIIISILLFIINIVLIVRIVMMYIETEKTTDNITVELVDLKERIRELNRVSKSIDITNSILEKREHREQ